MRKRLPHSVFQLIVRLLVGLLAISILSPAASASPNASPAPTSSEVSAPAASALDSGPLAAVVAQIPKAAPGPIASPVSAICGADVTVNCGGGGTPVDQDIREVDGTVNVTYAGADCDPTDGGNFHVLMKGGRLFFSVRGIGLCTHADVEYQEARDHSNASVTISGCGDLTCATGVLYPFGGNPGLMTWYERGGPPKLWQVPGEYTPFVYQNRLYVGIRSITELLGVAIVWNNAAEGQPALVSIYPQYPAVPTAAGYSSSDHLFGRNGNRFTYIGDDKPSGFVYHSSPAMLRGARATITAVNNLATSGDRHKYTFNWNERKIAWEIRPIPGRGGVENLDVYGPYVVRWFEGDVEYNAFKLAYSQTLATQSFWATTLWIGSGIVGGFVTGGLASALMVGTGAGAMGIGASVLSITHVSNVLAACQESSNDSRIHHDGDPFKLGLVMGVDADLFCFPQWTSNPVIR